MPSNYILFDAKYERNKIKLMYLSEEEKLVDWLDELDYYPYFYAKREDRGIKAAVELGCKVNLEEKKDLFTDKIMSLCKVSGEEDSVKKAMRKFNNVWEEDVQVIEKYAFDRGLRFGMSYLDLGGKRPIENVDMATLDYTLREMATIDPAKYSLAKEFYYIIEQYLPDIPDDIAKRFGYDRNLILHALYLSRITNTPVTFSRVPPSYFIKALYYFQLKRNGYLIPSAKEFSLGEEPRGVYGKAALVLGPQEGLYLDTCVLDYESLYPSCIDIYNLSHETVNCGHEKCMTNIVPEEKHHICVQRRGEYSTLIGALKDLRIKYYKKKVKKGDVNSKVISDVLKMILVICYGVTIRIKGLSNPALAESITAYARNALKTAWQLSLQEGLKPVYGDTDSVFLVNPDRRHLQTLIDRTKSELGLDIALDKIYKVCVFSSAKKAYLGIFENGGVDPKGLAAFKSSTPDFVKKILREVASEISKINSVEDLSEVRSRINAIFDEKEKELRNRQFDIKDLAFKVILHKKPSDIKLSNALTQPYQCALQIIDMGLNLERRQIITFIKVEPFNYHGKLFSVKPIQLAKKEEVSVSDYISNMRSMMDQILEPIGVTRNNTREDNYTLTRWFQN